MSAGILNEEAKKNYLRYSQEYYTAWIKHLPEIAEVARKFDGKKVTKRISTAIEKVNGNLIFSFEKSWENKGYVYLKWFDSDCRIFRDKSTDEWDYVKNNEHIIMHPIEDMESFDAEQFIEHLDSVAKRMIATKEEVNATLDNLDAIKAEYNETLAAFMVAREKIPYAIRDFYRIDSHYIGEWH